MNSSAFNKTITRQFYKRDSVSDLPFVADIKVKRHIERNYWHVPPTKDYGEACAVGYQWACDYLQFLKQNSVMSGFGILGSLVSDMQKVDDKKPEKGYAVGFISFMDDVLASASKCVAFYPHGDRKLAQLHQVWNWRDNEDQSEMEGALA
jgi:hypothetical protein